MKKLLRTLSMLLALAVLAMSRGTVSLAEGEKKSVDELGEVTFTFFQYAVEAHDYIQKAVDAYMKLHPTIHINLNTVGGSTDWRTGLKTLIASQEYPALFEVGGVTDFDTFGAYMDDLSNEPWVEHVYESVLPEIKNNGKVVTCPITIVNYGLLYNKAIFAACGINGADIDTFDELADAFATIKAKIDDGSLKEQFPLLEAVTEYPAGTGWIIGGQDFNMFLAAEFDSPLDVYNAKTFEFKAADAMKAYIDLMVQYTSNADNPSALNAVDYSMQLDSGFSIERVAVIRQGQWVATSVAEVDPEVAANMGTLPLPCKGIREDSIVYGFGAGLCVSNMVSEAQNLAARDFLNWFMSSAEGQDILVNEILYNPPFDYVQFPVANSISAEGNAYAAQGKTVALVYNGCPSGWAGTLVAGIQSYLVGDKTWDSVVADCIAAWAELRAK